MTALPLKQLLRPGIIISLSVISILSLPLVWLTPKQATIDLQQETLFEGQLKTVVTPYVAVASLIGLGAGMTSIALEGWRQSADQLAQQQDRLATLLQTLQETEAQIQNLKLSDSQLEADGLKAFLSEPVLEDLNPQDVEHLYTQLQHITIQMESLKQTLNT